MTLRELNEYARLRRELDRAENLKASLTEAVEPGAQALTGLPHAPGYRDKLGELLPGILDALPSVEERIESLREQAAQHESEIVKFIDEIPDIQTRTIFRLRFLGGFEWAVVAAAVGGGNTSMGIRQSVYRYLKSCNAM